VQFFEGKICQPDENWLNLSGFHAVFICISGYGATIEAGKELMTDEIPQSICSGLCFAADRIYCICPAGYVSDSPDLSEGRHCCELFAVYRRSTEQPDSQSDTI
jgi:hypothetical protein